MKRADRVPRWLDDLAEALDTAASLVARGRRAYNGDPAIPPAFEALSIRVGGIAKRLTTADPDRFSAEIWSDAAQHRDFVAHHYDRDVLGETVARVPSAARRAPAR